MSVAASLVLSYCNYCNWLFLLFKEPVNMKYKLSYSFENGERVQTDEMSITFATSI